MELRTTDVFILLVLGLLCIARASWGIFKDINVDLSDSKSVTGKVVSADIIKIEKATFKSRQYKTVFAVELDNSNQRFAVDRGVDVCNYLNTQIKIGDTIEIHYRMSTNDYNTFVFQVEKNGRLLADFVAYKKRETGMIILLYFFGIVILGGLAFWNRIGKKRGKLMQT